MNHDKAPTVLKEVFQILPECWLFGATLLGAIREGKIISWDKDIDIGVDTNAITDQTLKKFTNAGFSVTHPYKFDREEMKAYIPDAMGKYGKFQLRKYGCKVEIECFAQGVDGRWYNASGTPRLFVMTDEMINPLVKLDLYDFSVNVAKNAELQLEHVYGKDWKTPKQKWYFTADHYLRREHTIIELAGDDGTKYSKWKGRQVIETTHGPQNFPEDINTPHNL